MKARLKHTNQIINVERDPLGWFWESPKGNVILDTEELIFLDDDFDWQSFRAEAAKDILCAIISCPIIKNLKDDEGNLIPFDKFAATKVAIEYADELIKQIKEKEKK